MATKLQSNDDCEIEQCSHKCILTPIDNLKEGIDSFVCSKCSEPKHRRCESSKTMCNNCEFSDSNDDFIERLKNLATNLNNEKVELIHQEKREELKLNKLLQSKASLQGPVQKKFEESKKNIKIKELSHFTRL